MTQEQLIIDYFEGNLTSEDKVLFEQNLQDNADFAKEVAFQENLKKAITLNERKALKDKLKSFEIKKETKKPFKIWYVAASLIFFLGGGFWFINQSSSTDTLYNNYYQVYPNTIAPTVRGESKEDTKSSAFYEYDNGNYEQSFELFTKLYTLDKEDYSLFYSSMSLIELGKHNDAIVLLNKFDLNKENGFTPLIKWYKALCFLKLNKKQEAKNLIQSLASYQNPQQEMAIKLLKEID